MATRVVAETGFGRAVGVASGWAHGAIAHYGRLRLVLQWPSAKRVRRGGLFQPADVRHAGRFALKPDRPFA